MARSAATGSPTRSTVASGESGVKGRTQVMTTRMPMRTPPRRSPNLRTAPAVHSPTSQARTTGRHRADAQVGSFISGPPRSEKTKHVTAVSTHHDRSSTAMTSSLWHIHRRYESPEHARSRSTPGRESGPITQAQTSTATKVLTGSMP